MKLLVLCLLTLFFLCPLARSNNWIQKDGYLELNNNSDTIQWLKLSLNGKYLYALTNRGIIKKIDVGTGDTVKTWKNVPLSAELNTEDESYYIADYETTGYKPKCFIKKVYLGSDSAAYSFLLPFNLKQCYFEFYYYFNIKILISPDRKSIAVLTPFYYSCVSYIDSDLSGSISLYSSNDSTLIYHVENWMKPDNFAFGKGKHVAYSGEEHIEYYHSRFPYNHMFYNKIALDSNNKMNLNGGLDSGVTAEYLSFSKDDGIVLGKAGSKFNLWNAGTGKLIKTYQPESYKGYDTSFYNLLWSGNSNIFLHSYALINPKDSPDKKSIIKFYNMNLSKPVDSLVFSDTDQNYFICLGHDSTSFFTISKNNIVRWFHPDILSSKIKAYFESDKNIVLPGDTVRFTNGSIGNSANYIWSFGDGLLSNDKNPVHVYTQPGTYDVELIVNTGNKSDTAIKVRYITVNHSLKADFEADIQSGDAPLTVHFINKSKGDIKTYSWNFGDGEKDNAENPIHNYNNPGIYPVSLIVSDGTFGDTLIIKDMITVNKKSVSDKDFDKEIILSLEYTDIIGTAAFDYVSNNKINSGYGFLAEGYGSKKTTFYQLDKNLDTIRKKTYFTNTYHRPMQKVTDSLFYFIGDSAYAPGMTHIRQMTDLDNSQDFYILNFTSINQDFDYLIDTGGIVVCHTIKNIWALDKFDPVNIAKIDRNGHQVWSSSYIPYSMNYDSIISLRISKYFNEFIVVCTRTYSEGTNSKLYGTCSLCFDSTGTYHFCNRGFSGDAGYAIMNDVFYLSQDQALFIKNNILYIFKDSTLKILFNGSLVMSMKVIEPNRFLITGTKDKHPWYGFIDSTGVVLEEHTISERAGCFYSANFNQDQSVIFSGVYNKNAEEKYLYLYKTKPAVSDSFDNPISSGIKIYPNPAGEEIKISIGNSGIRPKNIRIVNCFGELVPTPEFTSEENDKIVIKLSILPAGVYLVNINTGAGNIYEKFIITR